MSQTLREILEPYVGPLFIRQAEEAISEYVNAQADEAFRDGRAEGYDLALEAQADYYGL